MAKLSKSRPSKVTRKGKRKPKGHSNAFWARARAIKFGGPVTGAHLPMEAYRADGRKFAMVRLRNPDNPTKEFANWPGKRHPFVERCYRTWTLDEWWKTYGNPEPGQATSPWWDFFGDPIDIWEGYSDE